MLTEQLMQWNNNNEQTVAHCILFLHICATTMLCKLIRTLVIYDIISSIFNYTMFGYDAQQREHIISEG